MKRTILVILITLIAFQSCKEKNNPDPENAILDYFPLSIGNYWVYERSSCDSTWSDCTILGLDTCHITKDTIIAEQIYYKLEGKNILGNNTPIFLRDSGDYLVNSLGHIQLSIDDINGILHEEYITDPSNTDTLYYIIREMIGDYNSVVVPAGTFECIDDRTTLFRVNEGINEGYSAHNYHAKNVGPVYQNALFASSLGGIKRELISFNIE